MADLVPASPTAADLVAALPAKMAAFVGAYLLPVDGKFNAAAAVRAAGYSSRSSNTTGKRLMKRPDVKAAITAARADLAAKAAYNADRCMSELGTAMEFAQKTDNASAFVRAVELRGKLSGVLVDKIDARIAVGMFSIAVEGLHG